MAITLSILVARADEPFSATLMMTLVVGIAVAAVILWNRRYRRIWQQYRGRSWPKAVGRFSSGTVITMVTARTQQPSGFEVWMDYQYKAGQQMKGIYKRPVSAREAGETYIEHLMNQSIPVRVAPRRPAISCVLDRDVDALIERSAVSAPPPDKLLAAALSGAVAPQERGNSLHAAKLLRGRSTIAQVFL